MDAAAGTKPTNRLWSEELQATLALAWPLILSNLTMALINATDVVLLGWLGARQLAAAALGLNLTWAFTLIGMGLVTASSPMMATAIGARRRSLREVRRTFRQSLWLVVGASLPLWLLLWNAEPVIQALGQEPDLARNAAVFLRGYMWSALPFLAFQAMRNFLSAVQRPGWILAVSLAGIGINAVLSWSLIFGRFGLPKLGLFGGGLGSSVTWTALSLALGAVLTAHPRFRRYHLFGRWWRADWPRLGRLLRLGLPIGLAMGFEGAVFSAAAYLMGLIDADNVAAHAIALQIAALTFMVPVGLGQAATVRVGRAFGARDSEAIARAGWTAFALAMAFMTAMALLMWAIPGVLVGLFLESHAEHGRVMSLAVSFLLIAAAFQVADGAQVIAAGMLRGLHDTRVPMLFSLVGYWVVGLGIGVWLAFGRGWGGVGLWTGLAAGLAFVAVLMIGRWIMRAHLRLSPPILSPR